MISRMIIIIVCFLAFKNELIGQDMEWKNRLKNTQVVVLDVDGTLTDGGMYYSAGGDAVKRFNVQDGMGITLLQRAGIEVVLLTSEDSPVVTARAKKLRI